MDKIDIQRHFAALPAARGLETVAAVNDTLVRLGTLSGSFDFHRHDAEDELFWVLGGTVTIEFRDREIRLSAGEMLLVPRGMEHRTRTEGTAQVVVVHPRSTRIPASPGTAPEPSPM